MNNLENACTDTAEYYVDRIHSLCSEQRYEDAFSLNAKLKEWIEQLGSSHEVMYLKYLGK